MDDPVRRRRRTTAVELKILEAEFTKSDKPSIGERERISKLIAEQDIDGPGMNAREIQVWFQNKSKHIHSDANNRTSYKESPEQLSSLHAGHVILLIHIDKQR